MRLHETMEKALPFEKVSEMKELDVYEFGTKGGVEVEVFFDNFTKPVHFSFTTETREAKSSYQTFKIFATLVEIVRDYLNDFEDEKLVAKPANEKQDRVIMEVFKRFVDEGWKARQVGAKIHLEKEEDDGINRDT